MPIQTVSQALDNEGRGSPYGFKNRIINGDMGIDQRNAGASVSIPAGTPPTYAVDRNGVFNLSDAGAITAKQDSSAPSGFSNSLKVTVTTADATVAATDRAGMVQQIEGFNTSDFGFGTTSAKTVTLSFWVRSSLTGTFGGNLNNYGNSRSYIFNYTISSADTWEYKTITIPGDTSGTWVGATNEKGFGLLFSLMAGTNFQGTVNTWNNSNVHNTSGTVNLLGTLNATWYITGVQLEKGSTATSFDYRPYGTELALCQRYYVKYRAVNSYAFFAQGPAYGTTYARVGVPTRVSMRTTPTLGQSAAATLALEGSASSAVSSITGYGTTTPDYLVWQVNTAGSITGCCWLFAANTGTAYLDATAEL